MQFIEIKETEHYAKIIFETEDGENLEIEAFKAKDILRINSGLEDRELVVKPRTSNELDIKLVPCQD